MNEPGPLRKNQNANHHIDEITLPLAVDEE